MITYITGSEKSAVSYDKMNLKLGTYTWHTKNVSGTIRRNLTSNKVDVLTELKISGDDSEDEEGVSLSVGTSVKATSAETTEQQKVKILSGNLINLFATDLRFFNVFANYYSKPAGTPPVGTLSDYTYKDNHAIYRVI
jgi:hypothetical protein